MLSAGSLVGVCLNWTGDYVRYSGSSRYMHFFNTEYKLECKLMAANMGLFCNTLKQQVQHNNNHTITEAYVECLCCEFYRKVNTNSKEESWTTTTMPGQHLYLVEGDTIQVIDKNGYVRSVKFALLNHFLYKDQVRPAIHPNWSNFTNVNCSDKMYLALTKVVSMLKSVQV